MNRLTWIAATLLAATVLPTAITIAVAAPNGTGIYDAHTYGAKGDGVALDTAAINKAIDAAAAGGGGTVYLSAGSYLSTSVHLQSNVTLEIGPGATLVAAAPAATEGYDAAEANPTAGAFQDFGHAHWHNSLIWGRKSA